MIENKENHGIIALLFLFIVAWVTILLGNPIMRLVGLLALAMIQVTNFHIQYSLLKRGGIKHGK